MLSLFLAQGPTPATAPPPPAAGASITELFIGSRDAFTYLLVLGSVAAVTVIIRAMFQVRTANVIPSAHRGGSAGASIRENKIGELRGFVERDDAFLSVVLRAALTAPRLDRASRREAAELAASEQCSIWFRKIEPLNVIGNLGPLLGLAGTVYGMIIAFHSLGQSGGQANPATLSLGISKALFHTLLGLMLALPALTVFGFYRGIVDRLCTRAMVIASELVEALPDDLPDPRYASLPAVESRRGQTVPA